MSARARLLLFVLPVACSSSVPGLVVSAVAPAEAFQQAPTPIRLTGTFTPRVKVDFQAPGASTRDALFRAHLDRGDVSVPLDRLQWVDHTSIEAVVPPGLASGTWSLRVVDPFDRQAILRDALTVLDCSVSTCTLNDGGVVDGGTPDAGVPEEDAGPRDAGPQPCATTTFADDDGDGFGRSGSAAMLCGVGRVTTPGDCDDVDPGTFPMAPEFCNRIDDDCDGTVDEGVCPVMNPNFIRRLELPTDKSWKTVSPFAAGRVWIAGRDDVWLRADGGFFEASSVSCPNEIRTSWAAPTGQAFVAGGNPALGWLADHALHASSCTNGRMMSDPVAGMWGTTLPDAGLLISGVLRNARRFDWRVPDQPLETPTNLTEPALRFEAAHQAGGLLLIAGAVDQAMRVYSWVGTSWAQEPIDRLNLPAGGLRAVWVLSGSSAFVVGDRGVVLERVGSAWRQLPAPSSATLTSVRAFNRARVYVTGSDGTIRLWNGRSWQVLYSAAPDAGVSLEDLDGVSESDLWAVGSRGFVVHWPE